MLNHPTLDRLNELGLFGMAKAFAEIMSSGDAATLPLAEGLGLLLDRESSYRNDKRLASRLRYAKLRHQAAVEDVDYRFPRSLDRALFQKLIAGDWIDAHDISSLPVKPGWENHGWHALWATRRAGTIAPCSTPVSRNCSMNWRSPAATAASQAYQDTDEG
jgi:hypothetical protein